MSDEPQLESRTKLPTELDQEDPLIIIAEFRMSLRQVLTLAMGLALFMIAWNVTGMIIPFASIFGALVWSWIPLGAIFLTFVKKDGEPYEEYLSQKLEFWLSDRNFINIDTRNEGDIADADWEEIEDDFLDPSL